MNKTQILEILKGRIFLIIRILHVSAAKEQTELHHLEWQCLFFLLKKQFSNCEKKEWGQPLQALHKYTEHSTKR